RRRSAQNDHQLFADIDQKSPEIDAVAIADQAKDDGDESYARDVDAEHQLGQREQSDQAILAYSKRHRAKGSKRSGLHDDGDDLEEDMGEGMGQSDDMLLFVERCQRDAAKNGQKDHLKNLSLGKCADKAVRNDVE